MKTESPFPYSSFGVPCCLPPSPVAISVTHSSRDCCFNGHWKPAPSTSYPLQRQCRGQD